MDLVAEGVETEEEGKTLIQLGCDLAQGYYYSRPADFDATTSVIRDIRFSPIGAD